MTHDLVFLHSGFFPECTAQIDKMFDGYYTLQFSVGKVELSYDDRRKIVDGRWFWTAYPGPRIKFMSASVNNIWEHRYVAFTGPMVNRWMDEGIYPFAPERAPIRGRFETRFDLLLASIRVGNSLSTLKAVNLLESNLIDLAETRAANDDSKNVSEQTWLAESIEALSDFSEKRDKDGNDYSAIANRAAMGLSTFRRRFKLATGLSPQLYFMHARASKARELLCESNLAIKSIAKRLGYNDVFFFTRQFKQLTGVTPGEYRKSRQ